MKAKTWASRIFEKVRMARWAMAGARFWTPLRSFQSRRRTKAMPRFWPEPPKLKPEMTKAPAILAFSSTNR